MKLCYEYYVGGFRIHGNRYDKRKGYVKKNEQFNGSSIRGW
jgi:hypothetical protein